MSHTIMILSEAESFVASAEFATDVAAVFQEFGVGEFAEFELRLDAGAYAKLVDSVMAICAVFFGLYDENCRLLQSTTDPCDEDVQRARKLASPSTQALEWARARVANLPPVDIVGIANDLAVSAGDFLPTLAKWRELPAGHVARLYAD